MSKPTVFDIQSRRTCRVPDMSATQQSFASVLDELTAQAAAWPFMRLRMRQIETAEQLLERLQRIIRDLRKHVETDSRDTVR